MTNIKHTPGPWSIGGNGADVFGPPGTGDAFEDCWHVADCQPTQSRPLGPCAVDVANARLVIASPDMSEALKAVESILTNVLGPPGTPEILWRQLDGIRAALAKARGEGS